MQNVEIAWLFQELADLAELKGEDFFKVRAYRRAAGIIAGLDKSVVRLYEKGELIKVPGIGKNILAKVGELISTGEMRKLQQMRREITPGLLEIMGVPGIGPKRARILSEQLMISSLDDLEEAARSKKIRGLPGMGTKIEKGIIRNIKMIKQRQGKILLGLARELSFELMEYFSCVPEIKKIFVTGSVRRWRETVGDIDLLIMAEHSKPLFSLLLRHFIVKEVLEQDKDRLKIYTRWGITVDTVVAGEKHFWSTLLWSTGSREHFQRLQLLAGNNNLHLDRYGLAEKSKGAPLYIESEEDIYHHLGLPFIPPELRENRGEIEICVKEGKLPLLIREEQIRGDLHIHSNWSDGLASIGQIIEHARSKGYKYIAITEHSHSLKIARGLSLEDFAKQCRQIKKLNEELRDIRILTGMEVDILNDGNLDCPDEVLEQMDVVIASVHTGFRQDRGKLTARFLSAVRNKHVNIIGHLTGRLLNQRPPYDLDVETILEEAGRHGKAMEINSSPDRLDLNEEHARLAKSYGVKLVINTDAHDLKRMDEMPYGVAVARRAWLAPSDVVNTMELGDLMRWLGR